MLSWRDALKRQCGSGPCKGQLLAGTAIQRDTKKFYVLVGPDGARVVRIQWVAALNVDT